MKTNFLRLRRFARVLRDRKIRIDEVFSAVSAGATLAAAARGIVRSELPP